MSNKTSLNESKSNHRIHFIAEWAEKRGMKQSDIVREIGADKSLVSRWYSGTQPKPEYLERLAALFETDVTGLFRDPDDDWLAKFFRDKTEEQKEQAINLLKAFFDQNSLGASPNKQAK